LWRNQHNILTEKPNREKKPIKPIKILKKPTGSVRFFKPGTKKMNRTEPKPKKTEKNRAKLVWTGFCSKKPNWNRSVRNSFNFFKKKFSFVIFFIKTEPNRRWTPLLTTNLIKSMFIFKFQYVFISNFESYFCL
jgi:hypothetical protein